jgi:hypothetical protein
MYVRFPEPVSRVLNKRNMGDCNYKVKYSYTHHKNIYINIIFITPHCKIRLQYRKIINSIQTN